MRVPSPSIIHFFFTDTPTTEIYTLSLHDALPISRYVMKGETPVPAAPKWCASCGLDGACRRPRFAVTMLGREGREDSERSEEHTSELQSRQYLVCRLLLEKKKNKKQHKTTSTSIN